MTGLKNDLENWTTDADEIKAMAFKYFVDIFQSPTSLQHEQIKENLEQIFLPTLSSETSNMLLQDISFEEVKDAVFSLPKDSASGPDGYHASFYQKNWDLISSDVFKMVTSVWQSEHLLKAMNKTNVVLIPKNKHPRASRTFGLLV